MRKWWWCMVIEMVMVHVMREQMVWHHHKRNVKCTCTCICIISLKHSENGILKFKIQTIKHPFEYPSFDFLKFDLLLDADSSDELLPLLCAVFIWIQIAWCQHKPCLFIDFLYFKISPFFIVYLKSHSMFPPLQFHIPFITSLSLFIFPKKAKNSAVSIWILHMIQSIKRIVCAWLF